MNPSQIPSFQSRCNVPQDHDSFVTLWLTCFPVVGGWLTSWKKDGEYSDCDVGMALEIRVGVKYKKNE